MTDRKITIDCVFGKEDVLAIDGQLLRDRKMILDFCKEHYGEGGFFTIQAGERTRRLKLMRFFYGPLLDAFVRLTGNPDRKDLKKFLKKEYLVEFEDGPDGQVFAYVKSLRDLSDAEMVRFIRDCTDRLAHEGGYLDEIEKAEWDATKQQ